MRYPRSIVIAVAGALMACESPTSTDAVTLTLSASELSLTIGEQRVLGALFFDANGRPASGSVTWSSVDVTIATVDAGGVVVAIAAGVTTITASAGALHATAVVSVREPAPPEGLSITYETATVIVGGIEPFAARLTDSTGRPVNQSIMWSTADSTVATVGSADGFVRGIGVGSTVIIATAGSLADSATVGVISMDVAFSFARWTPAGENNFTTEVFSYSPSDGSTHTLDRSPQFSSVSAPAWSSDGALLAVEVIHGFYYAESDYWLDFSSDVYVLDPAAPAGTPWRALTTNHQSRAPVWSPDGRRIALLQQRSLFDYSDVYVVDVTDGSTVRLTTTSGWYSAPRWSPDGLKLTFSDWERTHNSEVYIVNADGTGLKNLSQHTAEDIDPSWSPDGRHIAFVSTRASRGTEYHFDLYVMDADGTNPTRLTQMTTFSGSPAWSPDGRQILFTSGGSLFVMNADGSSVARLTTPPEHAADVSPAWKR